jgi:hypothetical protein
MVKPAQRFRQLLMVVIGGVLLFVAVSAFFAWRFTTPPRRPFGAVPDKFLSEYESVRFMARDGVSLSGWFVPNAGAK